MVIHLVAQQVVMEELFLMAVLSPMEELFLMVAQFQTVRLYLMAERHQVAIQLGAHLVAQLFRQAVLSQVVELHLIVEWALVVVEPLSQVTALLPALNRMVMALQVEVQQ